MSVAPPAVFRLLARKVRSAIFRLRRALGPDPDRYLKRARGVIHEDFIGWGGEDNKFLDRCLTRRIWRFDCLPMVHLWPPSPATETLPAIPPCRC